ncbi:Ran-specific GTPase-activating protein 30 [Coemansia javaensis]|uniref:Ran-specific GTPase-activating protein 30 n=1 Tax=Coemansia javaensis TaxID=2761396 RepID=A0A9W8LLS4_9FUNG|nr:Ran-specific GTPase-activating protein 30 [Coemansia javaensis]
MEGLFANLAMQTVQLVGKAAFGAAGSIALRRVSQYASQIAHTAEAQSELDRLRAQFEAKLRIVTPAIDLIDIIAARGHSAMSSVLQLTYALRADILAFSDKLARLDDPRAAQRKSDGSLVTLLRRATDAKGDGAAAGGSGGGSGGSGGGGSIESDLRELLAKIDNAVPLLNLALTTSGVHLGSALPTGISPGRLMQASALVARAATWFDMQAKARPGAAPDAMVGEPFTLRMYSLFIGSVRPKSRSDFTWKEEFARCHAALWRVAADAPARESLLWTDYCYELRIVEDRDDGRYHEDDDDGGDNDGDGDAQPKWVADMAHKLGRPRLRAGRIMRIHLRTIGSLHYTSAGSLLNIEDSSSPVLVVSVGPSRTDAGDGAPAGLAMSPSAATLAPEPPSAARWYALEVAEDDDDDDSDSESESEPEPESEAEAGSENEAGTSVERSAEDGSESDGSSNYESASDSDPEGSDPAPGDIGGLAQSVATISISQDNGGAGHGAGSAGAPSPSGSVGETELIAADEFLRPIEFLANEWRMCTLSLLEYMVRLASIEASEQMSHLEVPDEKLRLYLLSGPAEPAAAPGAQRGIPGGPTAPGTPHPRRAPTGATTPSPGGLGSMTPLPLGVTVRRRARTALGTPARRGPQRLRSLQFGKQLG